MNASVQQQRHIRAAERLLRRELGVNDFQTNHAETERRLTATGRMAVERDYTEVLMLGCTLEIAFHDRISQALGVAVIDPSSAALKRAEYIADLKRTWG